MATEQQQQYTEEQERERWERAKEATAKILQHVPLEKIEKLAEEVQKPSFRNSLQFKMFLATF